jgi:hypothetical protein
MMESKKEVSMMYKILLAPKIDIMAQRHNGVTAQWYDGTIAQRSNDQTIKQNVACRHLLAALLCVL